MLESSTSNVAFQIWTYEKWELLNGNDHSLALLDKLFLYLHMSQHAITSWSECLWPLWNSPFPTLCKLQRETLKAWSGSLLN